MGSKVCKYVKTTARVLFAVMILCCPYIFLGCTENNIYDGEVLRLVVCAPSDSAEDGRVAQRAADAVQGYLYNRITSESFRAVRESVAAVLKKLGDMAEGTAAVYGYCCSAEAVIERMYFARSTADGVTLPAGECDTVVIRLSGGKGARAERVIFPRDAGGTGYGSVIADLFGKT